jgi:hypothetical protein
MVKNYAAAGIPAQTWVSSIEPSKYNKAVVYATFDNHMYGDMKTYIAKSTDAGKTWKLMVSSEFTGFAHKIKEDIVNRDLLFLGTERGLFCSVDGGEEWFRMKNHIPDYCLVRDIAIQPQTSDLVFATHGRGIMVINNIAPYRALSKQVAESDVTLLDTKQQTLRHGKYGGGGSPVSGGWWGGNPEDLQPIEYYMKARSNDDVNLEIYDNTGKLVQKVPGTNRKGINKVYWNLRMTPPKTATGGAKPDFGGFIAPYVLPGTYTIKLKVGDKEYTSTMKLVHDNSNKLFTEEDAKEQYKVSMELYHLHEQLYALVNKINEEQKELKSNVDSITIAKNKKLVQEYNQRLEDLRTTLVAAKHKSIFADEKQLREDITELYGSVTQQEARPSNLQAARVGVLTDKYKKGAADYEKLNKEYHAKTTEIITKEKARSHQVMTTTGQ